ncbi:MAG: response regulator [Bacteroidales bacterium]|nr:response regulator [Bacteroidales bacterium]
MAQNEISKDKFLELRRQAEKLLALKGNVPGLNYDDDPLKLIHELQTFQIELELQNEELLRSQQELMESKIQYTELYDLAPVGYISLGFKGLILKSNLTFTDMLLTQRSLLLNQPLSAYIVPEDQDTYYHYKRNLADSKLHLFCELRMEKKDGTLLDVRLESGIVTDDSGSNEEYRIAVIDISDQKKAERDKEEYRIRFLHSQKIKAIGTLAGGIAHDFNNLLYMIGGNTELALEDVPKWNPAYTCLEEIKSASLRAAVIVKQLLNFSQNTDQKMMPIEAVTVIKESLTFLRSTLPTTVEINEYLPEDDIIILGDSTQINQVMMNLGINASQSMEETGGTLNIIVKMITLEAENPQCFKDLTPGNYLKITFSDTGSGINPEIVNEIFDPYFTTKEMGKGSGMGLSIVHGIVKNHGGSVSVDSQPGKGSSFHLLFPVVDEKPVNETVMTDEYSLGTETILFVDDEKAITDMAQKILEKLGYKVTVRLNPIEALSLFQSKPDAFDLVVTDMTMPHMTGVKLAQKLKEIRSDIPVIICTGHSSLIDEEKAKRFGIDGYLMKPMPMSIVSKEIRRVLDQ